MVKVKLLGEQKREPAGKGEEIDAVHQRYDLGCFAPVLIQIEGPVAGVFNSSYDTPEIPGRVPWTR